MAGSFNRVFLMGNLTRDIELRHTQGNQAVANLGLAVNRNFTTASGEKREETTFVDCEAWGKTAETMSKYLRKGRPVFIEGRLKLDQWEKDGQKQSKLRVVVESFQFVDSPGGGGAGGGGGGGGGASYDDMDQSKPSRPARTGAGGGAAPQIADDDIPF